MQIRTSDIYSLMDPNQQGCVFVSIPRPFALFQKKIWKRKDLGDISIFLVNDNPVDFEHDKGLFFHHPIRSSHRGHRVKRVMKQVLTHSHIKALIINNATD